MSAPADERVRRRALDPKTSFIVQAPAGSGKTELLTRRVLTLLGSVEEPEEILAITFTRKAASEMRERVVAMLARAADTSAAPASAHEEAGLALARAALARDRERGWQLLRNPRRLTLRTIDALATQLAHRLPVVSALGAPSGVVEDAWTLYREAASRFLDEHLAGLDLVLLQLGNRLERARDLLASLLAKRDQWQRYVYAEGASEAELRAFLEATLAELVSARLRALRESVPPGLERRLVPALARCAALRRQLIEAESSLEPLSSLEALPTDDPAELARWRAVREALLTSAGTVRRSPTRADGCPTSKADAQTLGLSVASLREHKAAFVAALDLLRPEGAPDAVLAARFVERLEEAAHLPAPRYEDEQWALLAQLLGALPDLLLELQLVFAERRVVDFVEMAERARRALGTDEAPTDLALAMDLRLRHVLVDEFQDTSRTQFMLFERLVAGWAPGDGRTFFAVGDPMQSIYRFRDGDVALFAEARERGIGPLRLEPLTLEVSFRAAPSLVGWINETFAAIFPARAHADTGAVPYAPSRAHLESSGEVAVHALIDAEEGDEAERVARLAGAALADDDDHTVAILLRSRSRAAAVFDALRGAGIAYRAIDMDPLGERPVVRDLLALTLALRYPHDRLHWLAVLRSPCAGLTLADLHVLMDGSERAAVVDLLRDERRRSAMSADGRARSERLLAVLEPAVRRAPRTAVVPWVEACWLRLGGPAVCRDAVDIDAAERCLARLRSLEDEGQLYQRALLAGAMDALYAAPGPDARVQVMTLHKAKGLEFDTVILPALERRAATDGVQLLDWFESTLDGAPRLLLAPIEERGLPSAERHGINRLVRRARERCDEQETLRLLYVACTRARRRLHLVARAVRGADGALRPPPPRTLLHPLWPRLSAAFETAASAAGTPAADGPSPPRAHFGGALERLPLGWTPPPMSRYTPPDGPLASVEGEGTPAFAWAGGVARDIGTVVHEQLRRLALCPSAREPAALERLPAVLERRFGNLGVPASLLEASVARALRAITGMLEDPRGRWLLEPHAEARSGWTISVAGRAGAGVESVVIDRTFVDVDGTRWIVDYKIGEHEGGEPERFLDTEQARYRDQLDRQADIISRIEHRPVRVGLYFPLLRGWREWTPGAAAAA